MVWPPRLVRRISAVRHGEKRRPGDVDARPAPARRGKRPANDRQREEAERQIDVEDPAPTQVLDKKPADQRANHGREPEDPAEDALVAAALARREEVADDRHRGHDQAAAAEALHRAENDSSTIERLRPHSAEPARNSRIADCSTILRPNRSPSLP